MLTVIVTRYNQQKAIGLPAVKTLTPKTARIALGLAFGEATDGEVWDNRAGYGYHIYPNTARKLHKGE